MDIRQITPKNPHDRKETAKIFEDYKRSKMAPVSPVVKDEPIVHNIPTILVKDLPSKFLPYPKDSIVRFKPFTYGDFQTFNASTMTAEDEVKFILDGIITEGFDKSLLLFQDFLFISVLRKLAAFNSAKFNYKFSCEDCGFYNEQQADIGDIQFADLTVPSLPIIVDVDDTTELCFSPLTIGASLKLQAMKNDDWLVAYAHCVVNMTPEKAHNIIKGAHGELIDILNQVDELLSFMEQYLECSCTACKKAQKFTLPEVQHLLLPFHGSTESVKSKIRFGRSGVYRLT